MRCTSWSLCTLYLLACQVTENAASTTSHPTSKEKFLIQLCCPWENIGKECQQVPEQGLLVHPCWGHWTVGFLWRNLRECTPKVVSDQHYNGMPHIGVCLGCLVSPQAQGQPTTWKRTMMSSRVHNQQLHRSVLENLNWSCLSELVMSWTTKLTDLAGDAPQNQQWPCRHKPSKLLLPRWRSVTRGPDWDTVPKKRLLLL